MKKILLLTACIAAFTNYSQAQSCCAKPQEKEGMSLLASNKDGEYIFNRPKRYSYAGG